MKNPWGGPESAYMQMQRQWRQAEDRASARRMLADIAQIGIRPEPESPAYWQKVRHELHTCLRHLYEQESRVIDNRNRGAT